MSASILPELAPRYVNRMQLSSSLERPAVHMVQQAKRFNYMCDLPPLLASCILIVAWLSDVQEKPSFADAAEAARVPASQVEKAFLGLKPWITRILPSNFVNRLPGGVEALCPR